MADVGLRIADPSLRLTLKFMLETDGHRIAEQNAGVWITDSFSDAVDICRRVPVLVLATVPQIGDAVAAMRQGVEGYIFVPFQPGEATLMVRRAAKRTETIQASARTHTEPAPHHEDLRLAQAERRHIEMVLRECRGNHTRASRLLGIGRNTLWRKLKQYAATAEAEVQS